MLEAIRLVKALLSPRTQNESNQVLFALGIASPHFPQRLRLDAVARDPMQPVTIGCRYTLSEAELAAIDTGIDQIAMMALQSALGQAFAQPASLIGYVSSPEGQTNMQKIKADLQKALGRIKLEKQCRLELTISNTAGLNATCDAAEINFVSFLEQRLPPNKTSFTYFPADRALPPSKPVR